MTLMMQTNRPVGDNGYTTKAYAWPFEENEEVKCYNKYLVFCDLSTSYTWKGERLNRYSA